MRQEATVRLHVSQVLTANGRQHWRQEAAIKAVLVQLGRLALGRGMTPIHEKVRVTFDFRFPVKRTRDRANLHPTVKPLLDGIVKAGVLTDDSDRFIEGPDIIIREELSPPGYVLVRVVLLDVRRARLTEAEAAIMAERDAAARERELKLAAKAQARRDARQTIGPK